MPSTPPPSPQAPDRRPAPPVSIVIPTRQRPDYLRVALASIAPQASAASAEVLVVDDAGDTPQTRLLADRFGARYEAHSGPRGLNVARNTGVASTSGDLVVFVDDDVQVCPGWLPALLSAAQAHPEVDVFTGPIRPLLEGAPPRSCGREGAPITSLELGPRDTPTRFAWGANMAIRRSALERIGPFDVSLEHGGDEQEWQERLARDAASVHPLYVAGAALEHRRAPADARLRPLCRAAYARGRAARRFDAWRGLAPSRAHELRTLAGCLAHVVLRRCPAGLTMVAHSTGRLREGLFAGTPTTAHEPNSEAVPLGSHNDLTDAPTDPRSDPGEDFLSGESGEVGGLDGLRRAAADFGADTLRVVSGKAARMDRAARRQPPTRDVLVLGIERPRHQRLVQAMRANLAHSRHRVEIHFAEAGDRGKFENLNLLLAAHPPEEFDWLLLLDDDIALPPGFLDRFLFLAERFSFDLAQPAHRLASHAAWRVTRRQARAVAHETRFVEIGPVSAFARSTFSSLLPFPELRMGWGLDLHWAALAREHGWRCGVIDATPIAHRAAPAADAYSRDQAVAEARAFLADHPYLTAAEAQQTLATHRRW